MPTDCDLLVEVTSVCLRMCVQPRGVEIVVHTSGEEVRAATILEAPTHPLLSCRG